MQHFETHPVFGVCCLWRNLIALPDKPLRLRSFSWNALIFKKNPFGGIGIDTVKNRTSTRVVQFLQELAGHH
jgi:hypothetical protein